VIRAHSVEELFDYAVAFAYQTVPRSRHVAIVTNAGGPGIMATDAIERAGLELATIDPGTVEKLRTKLPEASNFYNPVDCLGDADARCQFSAEAVLADRTDAARPVHAGDDQPCKRRSRGRRPPGQAKTRPPFMGAYGMCGHHFTKHHPELRLSERAVNSLEARTHRRREPPDRWCGSVDEEGAGSSSRGSVEAQPGEMEGGSVDGLRHRGADSRVATVWSRQPSLGEIGFPVVMKIVSPDILHKSDIGGVKVGIADRQQAMDTYELMMLRAKRFMPSADLRGVSVQQLVRGGREVLVGATRDPQFGPLVAFGLGGIYVEVLKDVAFRVAPFGEKHARRMIDEIRSTALLHGASRCPADLDAIVEVLLTVSQLVTDFPEIVEMDVNPLKVGEPGTGAVAVDARIIIAET
jgi:acetyltransferase